MHLGNDDVDVDVVAIDGPGAVGDIGDDLERHTHPDARDIATPCMAIVTISRALRGNSTGIPRAASERSLTAGTVDDLEAGSSPTRSSIPPRGLAPYMLACRSGVGRPVQAGPLAVPDPDDSVMGRRAHG